MSTADILARILRDTRPGTPPRRRLLEDAIRQIKHSPNSLSVAAQVRGRAAFAANDERRRTA